MTVTAIADKIALDRGRPVGNHTTGPAPILDDPPARDTDDLSALTQAAIAGDQNAWANLYVRYTPLISAVCRRHRLRPSDADDVGQVVWLRLIQHLKGLGEPRALPGWIATTTRNEALRVLRMHQRTEPADPSNDGRFDHIHSSGLDDHLLIAEQHRYYMTASITCDPNTGNYCCCSFPNPKFHTRKSADASELPSEASALPDPAPP